MRILFQRKSIYISHTLSRIFGTHKRHISFSEFELLFNGTDLPRLHDFLISGSGLCNRSHRFRLSLKYNPTLDIDLLIEDTEVSCVFPEECYAVVGFEDKGNAMDTANLKERFIQNFNHEIRTPLNTIIGFSGILATSGTSSAEQECYRNIIKLNTEILLKMLDNILFLSQNENQHIDMKKDRIIVNDLLMELKNEYDHLGNDHLQFSVVPETEDMVLETDYKILKLILDNLLSNAFKFTPKGQISLGCKNSNESIMIFVSDTGKGIRPNNRGKVFERFFKENSFTQGSGLGLAICKELLDHLGGQIYLDSEIGKGSTFYICLTKETQQTEEIPG